MPICLKAGKYKIFVELPLSTKIQWITWFAVVRVTTKASSWGITTPSVSSSEKDKTIDSVFAAFGGLCNEYTSSLCILHV
jgi:hypothetical protein